jgi:hypothetical protein
MWFANQVPAGFGRPANSMSKREIIWRLVEKLDGFKPLAQLTRLN